jgi:hypothetical protein
MDAQLQILRVRCDEKQSEAVDKENKRREFQSLTVTRVSVALPVVVAKFSSVQVQGSLLRTLNLNLAFGSQNSSRQ